MRDDVRTPLGEGRVVEEREGDEEGVRVVTREFETTLDTELLCDEQEDGFGEREVVVHGVGERDAEVDSEANHVSD